MADDDEGGMSMLERGARTIFGANRAIKDPLLTALKVCPTYVQKVNPAISGVCFAKDMYDAFTADNRRQGDVAAMQGVVDFVGMFPGVGTVASAVDAGFGVNKLAGGKSLAEYMADAIEPTETDKLDDKYQPPSDQGTA